MAAGLDAEYASIDALADVVEEDEARALQAHVAQLTSETTALRAQLHRAAALESKLEARKCVLVTNTTRLYDEAKALVEERDAAVRRLRMAQPVSRTARTAVPAAPRAHAHAPSCEPPTSHAAHWPAAAASTQLAAPAPATPLGLARHDVRAGPLRVHHDDASSFPPGIAPAPSLGRPPSLPAAAAAGARAAPCLLYTSPSPRD